MPESGAPFAIQREDGKFVAMPGSKHSYTDSIFLARRYPTRQQAEADACGNETVIDLRKLVGL